MVFRYIYAGNSNFKIVPKLVSKYKCQYGGTMYIMTMPLHIRDFHECVARKEHKLITSNQSFIKGWHIDFHMVFVKSSGYAYVDLGIT